MARTNIRILKGDALDLLPELIAESSGPLCIFHSACVLYWSDEAKAALDALLLDASHGREFFRVGLEPDIRRMTPSDRLVDIAVTRYRHGTVDSGVAARTSADCSLVTWLD